jgi:uncharacterized protein YjiS (DUF1127 family)
MSDHLIYDSYNNRYLVPAEWDARQNEILRQARQARAQALQALLVRALSRMRALAGRAARAFATWRANRRAVRELHALGDRTLKDFGIDRSEIESVVYGRDASRVVQGRIAAKLFHKPYAQPRNRPIPRKAA